MLATIAVAVELIRRDRLDRLTGRLAPHSGKLKRDWVVKLDADYVAVQVAEGSVSMPISVDISVAGAACCRRRLRLAAG